MGACDDVDVVPLRATLQYHSIVSCRQQKHQVFTLALKF